MESAVIDLIAQGGATGVFAVFAWWLVKEQRTEREKNANAWMNYLKERNGKTEKYMEAQTSVLQSLRDDLRDMKNGNGN